MYFKQADIETSTFIFCVFQTAEPVTFYKRVVLLAVIILDSARLTDPEVLGPNT